jgi:hypothetical protein
MSNLEPAPGTIPQAEPGTYRYYASDPASESPAAKRLWTRIRLLFVVNILLVIASGAQACFAYRSNELTRASLEETRISNNVSQAVQRAYLNLRSPDDNSDLERIPRTGPIQGIRLRILWENSGTTPARTAATTVTWDVYQTADEFQFEARQGRERRIMAIGPRGTGSIWTPIIPWGAIQSVMDRRHHLYVWGWVLYTDIFAGSRRRLTEFCHEVAFSRLPNTSPELINFNAIPCERQHNCYDEDCPDYQERVTQETR